MSRRSCRTATKTDGCFHSSLFNHRPLAAAAEQTWISTSKPAHTHLGERIRFDWLVGIEDCQAPQSDQSNPFIFLRMLDCNSSDRYSISILYTGAAISEQALAYAAVAIVSSWVF